jgi:uncharacterized membrane protein YidH (DUF202 family)
MRRDEKDLVKQPATYADAITAFAFVQSVAFSFSLAQHEVSDAVLKIPRTLPAVIIVAYAIYMAFVGICLWGEKTLLHDSNEDSATRKWTTCVWICRFAVVLFAAILSLLAIGATIVGAPHPNPKPAATTQLQTRSIQTALSS